MKEQSKLVRKLSLVWGAITIVFLAVDHFVFALLRPKMVNFQPVSPSEENLINLVGISLLLLLGFYLLSLFQLARFLKNAKKITVWSLLLVISCVLGLLFVFADVALLSDIGKQYHYGLSQPEWFLLYPIMAFQLTTVIVFTYLYFSGLIFKKQLKYVAKDSHIFIVVHYVGAVSGLLGLLSFSLAFFFSRSWNLDLHVTISSIVLLLPYFLSVVYWLAIKFQEKQRQWYDEKQFQDVGKSALATLILSVIFMISLFLANYNQLDGIVSVVWLPLYLFFVLFLFSVTNLFFSHRS